MCTNRRERGGVYIQSDRRISGLAKREMERPEELRENTLVDGGCLAGERGENDGGGVGERRGKCDRCERDGLAALLEVNGGVNGGVNGWMDGNERG